MRRLWRDKYIYEMNAQTAPAYEVEPGETFVVEVWDAFAGRYTGRKTEEYEEKLANPSTGPIYVRGFQPGDIMSIEILDIKPIGQGILHTAEGWKILDINDEYAIYRENLMIPLKPMIGVMGLAPSEGIFDYRTPGDYGGNMDTNDICSGSALCLKVQVPGGLLVMGDVHACMGEGESNGMGIEVAADITIKITKKEEDISSFPFIIRENAIISISSADTLDAAAWNAVEEMRKIVMKLLKVDKDEARLLVGVLGNVRISQIVNPKKTVRVEMPMIKTSEGWKLAQQV